MEVETEKQVFSDLTNVFKQTHDEFNSSLTQLKSNQLSPAPASSSSSPFLPPPPKLKPFTVNLNQPLNEVTDGQDFPNVINETLIDEEVGLVDFSLNNQSKSFIQHESPESSSESSPKSSLESSPTT